MRGLKRISMAGSDVAVTDAVVADLVLEYAMHLGRINTTDIVSVPVPDDGEEIRVELLLGPSSQIVVSDSDVTRMGELPGLDEIRADLRSRIERAAGRGAVAIEDVDDVDPLHAFVDFDDYESPR